MNPSDFNELDTLSTSSESIRKIGLRLLNDGNISLTELNKALKSFPSQSLNSRKFLQYLLKNKKISVENFLQFEKTDWTQIQEIGSSFYQFHLKKGYAEFSSMESQNSKKFCPSCRKEFSEPTNFCPIDGTELKKIQDSEEPTDPFIHLVIDDRYQILELLGKGGMGSVYKARHIKLEKIVAVKILQHQFVSNRTLATRFLREAQAASRLSHPNIIHVYDYGEIKSSLLYIAMEYLEGQSLRDYLDWRGTLSVEEACYILRQCLLGLSEAHGKQLVHRDIKPANLMVVNNPQNELLIKILDFGTAKILDGQADITQSVIGTPQYMSPEQAKGEGIDHRTDLYSLGITLYEMVTGERPFFSDTVHGYLGKHIHEKPVPLRQRCPEKNFSAGFEAVVMKSLEKDVHQRYASANDFLKEIENVVSIPQVFYLDQKNQQTLTSLKPKKRRFFFSLIVISLLFLCSGSALFFSIPAEKRQKLWSLLFVKKVSISLNSVEILDAQEEKFKILSEKYNAKLRQIREQQKVKPVKVSLEKMAKIPADTYQLGSDLTPDNPLQKRTVSEFYLDLYEVTNQEYFEFVQAMNYPTPPHWLKNEQGIIKYRPEEENFPVTQVTWFDCSLYASWRGKRLPTEWEYEIASMGKSSKLYPWGDQFYVSYTNTKNSSGESSRLAEVSAFQKDVSDFGVFHLAGNVKEWTANWYDPEWQQTRSIRGSSFREDVVFGTTHFRDGLNPCYSSEDLGFRCAWDKTSE